LHGAPIAPDGPAPQRQAFSEPILIKRLTAVVAKLNPTVPEGARDEAIRKVVTSETPSLIEENRRIHRLITAGVDVEHRAADGRIVGDKVWLIDLSDPDANDWLVVNQFTLVAGR